MKRNDHHDTHLEILPHSATPKREPILAWLSQRASEWSGSFAAFAIAALTVVVWFATGPLFDFSETWQLVINTGTSILTFLMVFLIQRAQSKDSRAIHLKLNELVAAISGASNRLINIESLSEAEIQTVHAHFGTLSELAKVDEDLGKSRSVEEAAVRHKNKTRFFPPLEQARLTSGKGATDRPPPE